MKSSQIKTFHASSILFFSQLSCYDKETIYDSELEMRKTCETLWDRQEIEEERNNIQKGLEKSNL